MATGKEYAIVYSDTRFIPCIRIVYQRNLIFQIAGLDPDTLICACQSAEGKNAVAYQYQPSVTSFAGQVMCVIDPDGSVVITGGVSWMQTMPSRVA